MVEPLSCAVHACQRANILLGSSVLICGSGSIGLLCMMTAKAMGATRICVTDIVDHKLVVAKKLGADFTLNVKSGTPEEIAKKVIHLMGGKMPEITMECTGIESSIRMGTFATKSGGKLVIVGLGSLDAKLPIVNAATREVDIIGSIRFINNFPLAVELIATGRVNVKALITHRYKIEDALEAFETVKTGRGNCIKVMMSC
ncbi:UNVERIFIED_CONTAM: hypothetical protein GTU68_005758 [Idotea baltica]|nr:hypothetical protein [Idotea baltica]